MPMVEMHAKTVADRGNDVDARTEKEGFEPSTEVNPL
jgi:hypothetical protein